MRNSGSHKVPDVHCLLLSQIIFCCCRSEKKKKQTIQFCVVDIEKMPFFSRRHYTPTLKKKAVFSLSLNLGPLHLGSCVHIQHFCRRLWCPVFTHQLFYFPSSDCSAVQPFYRPEYSPTRPHSVLMLCSTTAESIDVT